MLRMMLIALAMVAAPFAVQSGAAMAVAPADHHAQMAAERCDDQSSDGQGDQSGGKSCCAAMCTAAAFASAPAVEPHVLAAKTERPGLDRSNHSFLAELPTPPPRTA